MNAREKADLGARLKRISGQVAGLHRMVDGDRALVDLITQVSAVRAALRSVTDVLLASHVEQRASDPLKTESARERREFVTELVRLVRMRDA